MQIDLSPQSLVLFVAVIMVALVILTLVNIAIFGLSLKLYTEYFKDKSMNQRFKNKEEPSPPGKLRQH